jgi:XTP/dITP diphosphohydrolase
VTSSDPTRSVPTRPGPTGYVLATANPDKAKEIIAILAENRGGPTIEVRPRPSEIPDVEETGETLVANARLKAVALSDATGLVAIADDTGLEVDAIGGAPGVYSARYAGEDATYADNVGMLLAALDGVADRRARFRTVALARWPDGREIACEGTVHGVIAEQAKGTGGFGYDPVFVPDEGGGRTFAEMEPSEKHVMSHRGRAFRALAERLP